MENVYASWKPVDHGHPLRDATLFYSPPSLERVRMADNDATARTSPSSGATRRDPSRARSGDSAFPPAPALVIPATPAKDEDKRGKSYSVYGSPDVDYSVLYSLPATSKDGASRATTSALAREDALVSPALANRRDHHDSAVGSRAADAFQFGGEVTTSRRRTQVNWENEKMKNIKIFCSDACFVLCSCTL